jgi:hypothetical protein
MKLIFRYFLRNGADTKDEFTSLISKTAFKQYGIREKGMDFYIYLFIVYFDRAYLSISYWINAV